MLEFVQGEQAVLFAIKMNNLNTASDLAKKLNVTKARMTIIINNLKKKKFLKIKYSETDKRVKILELTKIGEEFINLKEKDTLFMFATYMEKMGSEKIITLTNLLKETANIMKGAIK